MSSDMMSVPDRIMYRFIQHDGAVALEALHQPVMICYFDTGSSDSSCYRFGWTHQQSGKPPNKLHSGFDSCTCLLFVYVLDYLLVW